MKKITTTLLALLVGLAFSNITNAKNNERLSTKCKTTYSQFDTILNIKKTVEVSKKGFSTLASNICSKGLKKVAKKINKQLKKHSNYVASDFRAIECKRLEHTGFMGFGRTWTKYKTCDSKHTTKLIRLIDNNKLVKEK
jgi:hypothetical protein